MKAMLFLFSFLTLSINAKTQPDKFTMHCSVMTFIERLELIDPKVQETVKKGIDEGEEHYDGQTGSLCYKISVFSDGENTSISIILLEKEIEYVRSSFNFRNGKLDTASLDVFLDNNKSYSHFYVKGNKKLGWQRGSDGVSKDFSVDLFEEHLIKVTPL